MIFINTHTQTMCFWFQALIHVSTAYCNCDRSDVAEEIYTPPYNPNDVISLVQWLPEDLLDKVRLKKLYKVEQLPQVISTRFLSFFFLLVNTVADWKSSKYIHLYKSTCRGNVIKGGWESTFSNCSTIYW